MASTSSLLWGRASSKFALQYVWNVSRRLQSPVFSNTFQCRRRITTTPLQAARKEHNEEKTSLTIQGYFASKDRSKETFLTACDVFRDKGPHLRGHVEFIYAALKNMEDFGVHKDLELYKKLLNLMPKGKMIPQNMFQVEFMHYPKQQQCAIDCLEQMETHGVMPDTEMEQILLNAFGKYSHPIRKYGRMMYWMPKFKNASPWLLPDIAPNDAFELAKLAVARMCTVDPASTLSVFETKDVEDAIEDTWIVSGQSLVQQDLLNKHSPDEPIKVEGPFRIFLRDKCVGYFILRAEAKPRPPPLKRQEIDDVGDLKFWFTGEMQPDEEVAVSHPISVHEQEDGTILAICATGTSGRIHSCLGSGCWRIQTQTWPTYLYCLHKPVLLEIS
ncbi:evolutionarily conserved signaling intermediate in Toll pathway, mitochondrial-like [Homarus americanus]|uniref:evolutionarily conserved signaling intermediate in Toll pathway, mitochondrial-like n=1 Tax=Homarus americanus TaxID=6706 RepID=UPI001C43D879|nr:evolutionarily conserved signaling intermediate in Toll pathway, mitochondrial-like [Homarus americanus]